MSSQVSIPATNRDNLLFWRAWFLAVLIALGYSGLADAAPSLVYSTSANRAAPQGLQAATVSGTVYIVASPDPGTRQIRFWLDNPTPANPTGTPTKTENSAPFDFQGTATNGNALPWNTAGISNGTHTITVIATLTNGSVQAPVSASFTIANQTVGLGLRVSTAADRSGSTALANASLKGNAYIFTSPDTGVSQVSFWLDNPSPANPTGTPFRTERSAAFDFNGTAANGTALPWNTALVPDGTHTITARTTLTNGSLAAPVNASFTVANTVQTPSFQFQPASLQFQAIQGNPTPDPQCVTVSLPSGTAGAFTAGDDATWLSVTPVDSSLDCANAAPAVSPQTTPAQLRVAVDPANLSPGTYRGNVSVQDTVSLAVTRLPVTLEVQGCAPLPCSQVLVQLPYVLQWDADQGKLLDRYGQGTGFTYIWPTSLGSGYLPQNLLMEPATPGGRLAITTTRGLMQTTVNTLDNGLGVGIAAPNQVSRLSTTLAAPLPAASGNFEQAGLWFGIDEDNYIKLDVISRPGGYQIESLMEVRGVTSNTRSVVPSLTNVTDIGLSLVVNPTNQTVSASWRLNGGSENALGSVTAPPEFFSFDAAGIDPRLGTRSFGGIYASHRNGPAPVTFRFKEFSVTAAAPATPPAAGGGLDFARNSVGFNSPTSLAFGPDNRLYAAGLLGNIEALTPNPQSQFAGAVQRQTIGALQQAFPQFGNQRLLLGIAIDPESTPDNVILWVAHSDPSLNAGSANSSMVSRISKSNPAGSTYDTVTHVITGLPRAIANHAINSLHFGPDGKLYIALAGNTGAGGPNTAATEFGPRPEQPLSAALLVADVKSAFFQGQCASAVNDSNGTAAKTVPATCDVAVYSSGLRNLYDFVFHSNGQIYGPDNGLGVTGSYPRQAFPDCQGFASTTPYTQGGNNPGVQPDTLQRLLPGKYYGHPNPARDECVFKDGHFQGVSPLPNYEPPLAILGDHLSSNGIVEYPVNVGCAGLKGELLISNYSLGNDLTRVKLAADGLSVLSKSSLVGGFTDPLPVAVSPQGTIYVGELSSSRITALTPLSLGCWNSRAALPQAILDAGGTALDGKFYVVAGKTSAAPLRTLYIYDPAANSWAQGPDLPGVGVENPAVVALNGLLYVFGGSTGPFSGAVANAAVYNPATNAWTPLASMLTARGGAVAQAIGGLVYVTGGLDANGASLSSLEIYNPATNTWTQGTGMSVRRDNPGSAALGGRLYVFGGRTRNADGTTPAAVLSSVEMYDPATGLWTLRAAMPTARRTMAVGTLNGRAQLMGGEGTPAVTTIFTQNEEYDPVTNTWRSLSPMSLPRHGAAAGTIGDSVFVAGGGPSPGSFFSNANTAFGF